MEFRERKTRLPWAASMEAREVSVVLRQGTFLPGLLSALLLLRHYRSQLVMVGAIVAKVEQRESGVREYGGMDRPTKSLPSFIPHLTLVASTCHQIPWNRALRAHSAPFWMHFRW